MCVLNLLSCRKKKQKKKVIYRPTMEELPFFQESDLLIKIQEINMHIVCGLCAGYFIDATTISECSHTFCKSCIVKHLQTKKSCPECGQKIHETQPLLNLRSDRVMQDVVYKLVPNLFQNEQQREAEFCRCRGTDFFLSKSHLLNIGTPLKYTQQAVVQDICDQTIPDFAAVKPVDFNLLHCYKYDEICTIRIVPDTQSTAVCLYQTVGVKFIQCPTRARVGVLKKIIKKICKIERNSIILTSCGKKLHDLCMLKHIVLLYFYNNRRKFPTIVYKIQ